MKNGFLAHEELKNIAYFQNQSWESKMVDYPHELDKKTEKIIKNAWAKKFNIDVNDVIILNYYGTYNDCVAIMLSLPETDALWTETIDGVEVYYNGGNRIYIWKAN